MVCGLAIIDVRGGVADGHEESIVNDQVSDVNYQESLGDCEAARPMCSSGGTEFSPLRCQNSCMQCSPSSGGGVLTGGAKLSL